MTTTDPGLAERLVLDELFDLTLYRELRELSDGDLEKILSELIPVETEHFAFWQKFFDIRRERLDMRRRLRLRALVLACRLFGPNASHLVLEGIEIYGVRKYLSVWERYRGTPLGEAVRGILEDEFKHEDAIVSQATARKLDPDRIRSIFLGLNDGLVEILGAVSGFFAAFQDPGMVLMAGSSVAVAGAISMAAGAFVAADSEREMRSLERGRERFLGREGSSLEGSGPLQTAAVVGVSYFLGASIPVLPVLLGARSVLASAAAAGAVILLVSLILSFLSGMAARRRMVINLVIMAGALGVTYAIGLLAKSLWGISL